VKIYLADIEQRIVHKENRNLGIVNYDIDNAYPTRVREMISASGTASSCVDTYSRFIEGQGFVDTDFYKAKVNNRRLTMDKLLRKLAKDYAMFKGFAIHINYNGLLQPVEFNIVSFEDCRLPAEDNDKREGMIAVYDDWGKRRKKYIKKDEIKWYDIYTSNQADILSQINKAGGIENWKGHIFWYSADGDEYPFSPADPVLEDIDTDAQIKSFRNNSVRSGFLDHMLFIQKGKFESAAEKEDFKKDLRLFQGAKRSTQIFLVEVENDNEIPEIKPIPSTDSDEKFKTTNTSTKEAIIENYGIPPVLLNQLVPGKLGSSTEISDAINFYNLKTSRERVIFEETAIELCKDFYGLPIPKDNNYSIKEIAFNNGVINNSSGNQSN
jgi:hypothetical protein